MTKYLVIDPGHSSGWCLFTINNFNLQIRDYGFYDVQRKTDLEGDSYLNYEEWVQTKLNETKAEVIIREGYFFKSRFRQGSHVNVAYRTVIDMVACRNKLKYFVVQPGEWKGWICGRSRPSKLQIQQYGKTNAKKWMVQEALYCKYQIKFPNFSLSQKNGKKIKFRHDTVDAIAMAIFFGFKQLNIKEVEMQVELVEDVDWKGKLKCFSYDNIGKYNKCNHVFKSGKRKGEECGRVCFEFLQCKAHSKK